MALTGCDSVKNIPYRKSEPFRTALNYRGEAQNFKGYKAVWNTEQRGKLLETVILGIS